MGSDSKDEGRRAAARRRTLKQGKVVLSKWVVIDCVIRDLSDTGARLEFAGVTELPNAFQLVLTASNEVVPVEVAWRRGLAAGVRFTGPRSEAPSRKS